MIADRWGVTDEETRRHYACDDIVPRPVAQAWRGITVETTPEQLWPWVSQIRLAPYSYDWIDNLGRQSPRHLRDLPEPAPGQRFSTAATVPLGQILSVAHLHHITGRIVGVTISYTLVPESGTTRLIMKLVTGRGRTLAPPAGPNTCVR